MQELLLLWLLVVVIVVVYDERVSIGVVHVVIFFIASETVVNSRCVITWKCLLSL